MQRLLILALFAVTAGKTLASDPVGVFALIDKVVLEPSDAKPERVQIWGAFAIAKPNDRDAYQPPQKGWLYYKLPKEKAEVAVTEWKDLKKAAGSGEVIGFGVRYELNATVHPADKKSAEPEAYIVGWGLTKMSQRSATYPPIKALLATRTGEKKSGS